VINVHLQKGISVFIGLLVSIAVTYLAWWAFILLGVFTGVIGICAAAPEWWARAYLYFMPIIPAVGIAVGRKAARRYTQQSMRHNLD
jgi:type II secretory pathway component PulF